MHTFTHWLARATFINFYSRNIPARVRNQCMNQAELSRPSKYMWIRFFSMCVPPRHSVWPRHSRSAGSYALQFDLLYYEYFVHVLHNMQKSSY